MVLGEKTCLLCFIQPENIKSLLHTAEDLNVIDDSLSLKLFSLQELAPFRNTTGDPEVAGYHRASPSTSLDKIIIKFKIFNMLKK